MFKKRVVKLGSSGFKRKHEQTVDFEPEIDSVDQDGDSVKRIKQINQSTEPKRLEPKLAPDAKDDAEDEIEVRKREKQELKQVSKPVGPLKPLPSNIRTTTIVDFQPDICKDFLKTGYCGYGDTCKFLHVRHELTQKKAITKDWQISDDKTQTSLMPFKCVICEKDYENPVKIECGHIYCKKCFLVRYKTKKECMICGKECNGIINPVSKQQLGKLIEEGA